MWIIIDINVYCIHFEERGREISLFLYRWNTKFKGKKVKSN